MIRIALIGDIHRYWDQKDTDWFNDSDYDLVLFVGDLPGRSHLHANQVASIMAGLKKPGFFIPGNHDGVSAIQFLAELKQNRALLDRSWEKQKARCDRLRKTLGPIVYSAYSRHPIQIRNMSFDLIAGRPHSMGGPNLSFVRYMKEAYGVSSLEDSLRLMEGLIDQAGESVLFLCHNGPSGLGSLRSDIWGSDFSRNGGDWGDPDLEKAVEYARTKGRRVLGVLAGHMHHRLRGSGFRIEKKENGGTLYLNAACVPRIFHRNDIPVRHHIRILTDGKTMESETVLVGPDGVVSS